MRPIACESGDIKLIAPISCKMSSASIVSAQICDSEKDTSSYRTKLGCKNENLVYAINVDRMGRAVIEVAQRKRVKYKAKCVDLGYSFLPFSFSSFEELEKDVVILLKRIRMFTVTQDIGARVAVHIFSRISFAIARGVKAQIVSRLPTNYL
nr:hypothetical protein [Tanacetum cinerariifolium]